MFNVRKGVILIAALLIHQVAKAQETVTLEQAVQHALDHKADALKAKLDVENSEYKIQEARANALPQINGSGSLTHNALLQQMALTMGGQTTVIRMGQPWQSQAAVQLDQQIFNLAVFTGLKAAKTTREFYIINEQLTQEQVVEKVANSYYEVYKTKSQLVTLDRTINNTTRVRDILSSLFQNGLAKKIDLDRMNVSLNNLLSSRQQLVNALSLQENSLKYLIGMDIATPIILPEQAFKVDMSQALQMPDASSLNNRVEILMLEKQADLLTYNKQAINAQRYPTLGFSANYGYLGLGETFPYFAGKNNGVNWSDFSAFSLNLRVPIFSGFSTRSKVRQAQVELDKLNVDITDAKLGLQLGAQNAFTQMKNAILTLQSQENNQQLAKEVLDNVENNYKNGLATLTDLLDAETAYADAQNSYTNAMLEYKLAEVQLAKANGNIKEKYTNQSK